MCFGVVSGSLCSFHVSYVRLFTPRKKHFPGALRYSHVHLLPHALGHWRSLLGREGVGSQILWLALD